MTLKLALVGILLLAERGCTTIGTVTFGVPQPEGSRNEKMLPKSVQGKFREVLRQKDKGMTTILLVERACIVETQNYRNAYLWTAMTGEDRRLADSVRALIKDFTRPYVFTYEEFPMEVLFKGDSFFVQAGMSDTLFCMGRNSLVRRYRNDTYINTGDSNRWKVRRLSPRGDTLLLRQAELKDAIMLSQITGVAKDTLYHFRPTPKQWKAFVKGDGFQTERKFVRVRD